MTPPSSIPRPARCWLLVVGLLLCVPGGALNALDLGIQGNGDLVGVGVWIGAALGAGIFGLFFLIPWKLAQEARFPYWKFSVPQGTVYPGASLWSFWNYTRPTL
jgi:hypothetical protein